MRVLVHAMKSLSRRRAKTIMLFLILFVVFNLIFTGFIIENSIKESKDYIRLQIGSAVEYRIDFDQMISGFASGMRGGGGFQQIAPLSLSTAQKIATSPYVVKYFITDTSNASSSDIDPAQSQQEMGGFIRGFSSFTLKGTNNTQHLDFVTESVSLKEGVILSENNLTNHDKVIIISDQVAAENDLRIGDIIKLSRVSGMQFPGEGRNATQQATAGTEYEFEIIGIYKANTTEYDINTIFTSNNVISDMSSAVSSDDTTASIVYFLNHPDNIEAFIKESSPYLTSEYHTLYSDDEKYLSLTRPLDLISVIASLLISVVFMAGAAIILAVVTIFVRDRKFEIGLLLASGESRIKIITQFVVEMTAIALVSFMISTVSSSMISGYVGNWIVDNQLLSTDSIILTADNPAPAIGNMAQRFVSGQTQSIYGDVDMQDVAREFDPSLNPAVILQLFLSSIVLVAAGSGVPLTVIMGYKPRRILQD